MLRDLLIDVTRSLRAHALRFGLTALGVVWGCFLLTYVNASLSGAEAHFEREMAEVGPRIIVGWSGSVYKERVGERGAREVDLEPEDMVRLASLHSVEHAAPDLPLWSRVVRAGGRTKLFTVYGISADSGSIRNLEAAEGRFLSPLDVSRSARVAVLGPVAARRLFGGAPPLGRRIQIESISFRVVGVTAAKGEQMVGVRGWDDWSVFVPYTAAQRWLVGDDRVAEFVFAPRTREESDAAMRHARQVLGLHHGFDPDLDTAVSFFDIQEVLALLRTVMGGLDVFQISAGLITLLVGAVGVMNIMLVVVAERRSEIGLRKAVGATRRSIFVHFLAESGAICGLSGIAGALLGAAFTKLVEALAPPDGPLSSLPVLQVSTVVLVTGALVLVGTVAAVVPALRAARVDPADALRGL